MVKIHLFFEKIVEKICIYQKKAVPLHRQTKTKQKQNNYNYGSNCKN